MKQTFIIAEAGVNHNGDIDLARRLVDAAKKAGADAVKFQTFVAERLVRTSAQKAEYQKKTTGSEETQFEMIKKLELSRNAHIQLQKHCADQGIEFLSTAFDLESLHFLRELGISRWKIPSGEITNLPFLKQIGSFGEQVLLSTGMATLGEVEDALSVLESAGTPRSRITILHCTTEYPAPLEEVNLRAMVTMGNAFGMAYGYSDHTQGISVPIAATALGATIIEKHFTLDRGMQGPDHRASLDPRELEAMVRGIRDVELSLGDGVKRISTSEARNRAIARKSIVAAVFIRQGQVFHEQDLTTKRPGTGISPMEWDRLVGRTASSDFAVDEEITW